MKSVCMKSSWPIKTNITEKLFTHITTWSLWERDSIVWISVSSSRAKIGQRLVCGGVLLCFNEPPSQSGTSRNYCPGLKRLVDRLMTTAFGVGNTYRTMVLRNQGLLAMEGTASSIRGCILMKLSVSSGNSLDTLYLSMDEVPAQLPGLRMKRQWGGGMSRRREKKHKRKAFTSTVGGEWAIFQARAPIENRKFYFPKINASATLNY